MSGVEARIAARVEQDYLNDRYAKARAEIERNRLIENGQSGALLYAAMAYGDVMENNTLFQKASHAAMLFCIAAACIIPNLLLARMLM